MGHVHVDAPHLRVALEDHGDLPRRLHEIDRLGAEPHKARHAGRRARRARRISVFPGKHLIVVLFHYLGDPWLEIGISDTANAIGRLLTRIVGHVTIARVLPCGERRATDFLELASHPEPSALEIARGLSTLRARFLSPRLPWRAKRSGNGAETEWAERQLPRQTSQAPRLRQYRVSRKACDPPSCLHLPLEEGRSAVVLARRIGEGHCWRTSPRNFSRLCVVKI